MRDLNWIKKSNKPNAGITGSRDHLAGYKEPEAPIFYRYVKENFNAPATWWDHLKVSIRAWALYHLGYHGVGVVYWLFKNIRSTAIPVVYEIHTSPKPKPKGRAK